MQTLMVTGASGFLGWNACRILRNAFRVVGTVFAHPVSLEGVEFRTPICADAATEGLRLALDGRIKGLLHLGGRERISRYAFGVLMAEVFDLSAATLIPTHPAEVPMPAPRPADVSLDSSRAFGLGYDPGGVREQRVRLRNQLEPHPKRLGLSRS